MSCLIFKKSKKKIHKKFMEFLGLGVPFSTRVGKKLQNLNFVKNLMLTIMLGGELCFEQFVCSYSIFMGKQSPSRGKLVSSKSISLHYLGGPWVT